MSSENPRCKFCAGKTILLDTHEAKFAFACLSCGKVTVTGTETAKFEDITKWSSS